MGLEFSDALWHWRGRAPHAFVRVPEGHCAALKAVARLVTCGWDTIPARVRVGDPGWATSRNSLRKAPR